MYKYMYDDYFKSIQAMHEGRKNAREGRKKKEEDYYANIDRVVKHAGKLKEYKAEEKKIINERIPILGDVYWKHYAPHPVRFGTLGDKWKVFPGNRSATSGHQYVVTEVRDTRGRRGWSRVGFNYGHIEVDYLEVHVWEYDPKRKIRLEKRATARFDEWEQWREIFSFKGHLSQRNGQPSKPFDSIHDIAMLMVGIDKKKEEEKIKEEERQENERVQRALQEILDREREEKEARERERARKRREIDERAEWTARAMNVKKYLSVKPWDATHQQIEEAERDQARDLEKEREERRKRREKIDKDIQDGKYDYVNNQPREGYAPAQQRWYFAARPKLKF